MAKPAVQFACTECGYSAGRWFGKCPGCNAFGTLVEEVVGKVTRAAAPPKPLLRQSEEHTSELQSHLNLVCRLLLEKKKKKNMLQNNAHIPRPRVHDIYDAPN